MGKLKGFEAVAAAVPLEDTEDVKAAKAMFYKAFEDAEMGKLAELQEEQIPEMYMADSADVAAAKADFMKYFDAREKGIPLTPGALTYAAPALTYAAPSIYNYNYALPSYTYANTWAHTAINPYYYAPSTYANILPYAAIPTVAIKAEDKKME